MKKAISSTAYPRQKPYPGVIDPLKKVMIRKDRNGYNIEAVLEGLQDDNYKVIISNSFINIMMAIPKFSSYNSLNKYYVLGRSSILLPEPEFNTISSIHHTNDRLKIRLTRSTIHYS